MATAFCWAPPCTTESLLWGGLAALLGAGSGGFFGPVLRVGSPAGSLVESALAESVEVGAVESDGLGGVSLRSTRGATAADAACGEVGEVTLALGVLDWGAGLGGSAAGAVLEARVVESLAGLSVPGSELVVTEGSKSTTVAVVSAACL